MPVVPRHSLSPSDRAFQRRFESGDIEPDNFTHREHLRLAYIYLVQSPAVTAHERVRSGLRRFMQRHGVDPRRYHETITRAWMLAVRHFMNGSARCTSFDAFIAEHPKLMDPAILESHYSRGVLESDEARRRFVEPDLEPIPSRPSD